MYGRNTGAMTGAKPVAAAGSVSYLTGYGQEATYDKPSVSQEMRQLIRELKRSAGQDHNSYALPSDGRANGFMELSGSSESDEKEAVKKPVNYNYKEVASKIQQAKTSVSAERAVLSASRKVLEIKRKISAHDGDSEELQLALTHAERMEMAARKKKHHLELEELAAHTQKSDENRDRLKEAASDMKNALVMAEEEKVTEKEDAIFDERKEMLHEAEEQLSENKDQASEDMLSELNEMTAELGEEELKQLQEAMEMLENMEIIDPHMSREELEELKRKHRAAENKAIVKADMDYLKDMIRHQLGKGGSIPGMNGMGNAAGMAVPSAMAVPEVSVQAVPVSGNVSIDVQV